VKRVKRRGAGQVRQLATKQEYDAALSQNELASKTTFVDFTATWCGPCQLIGPVFDALAKEHPQADFIKIDVGENPETAQEWGVCAMPAFHTIVNKQKVADLTGADEAGLRAMIAKHTGSELVVEASELDGELTRDSEESSKAKYCKFDDIRAMLAASRARSYEQGRDGCCGKAAGHLGQTGAPPGNPWSRQS